MERNTELTSAPWEQKCAEEDVRLREADLVLRREEMHAKLELERAGRKASISPLALVIISGIVGLLGTGVGALMQGYSSMNLERQKFQSELILKAIETGNGEAATKNLLFLVRLGFIPDPTGKIAQLQHNPSDAPVLPAASKTSTDTLEQKGLSVQAIQQLLKDSGYYTGEVNGLYGPETIAAVKSFQVANGLVVDGFITTKTAIELKKLAQQNAGNK